MAARGLPLAYVITVGNQAQTGLATIGVAVLEDPRVLALVEQPLVRAQLLDTIGRVYLGLEPGGTL